MSVDQEALGGEPGSRSRDYWNCQHGCPGTLNSIRALKHHRFTVHGRLLKWCKPCGADFDTDEELKAHEKQFGTIVIGKDGKNKTVMNCQLPCALRGCTRVFTWQGDLLYHLEHHHLHGQSEALDVVRYDMQAEQQTLSQLVREECCQLVVFGGHDVAVGEEVSMD